MHKCPKCGFPLSQSQPSEAEDGLRDDELAEGEGDDDVSVMDEALSELEEALEGQIAGKLPKKSGSISLEIVSPGKKKRPDEDEGF